VQRPDGQDRLNCRLEERPGRVVIGKLRSGDQQANQRAAARMLELLDETGADLPDEALRGAWRDGGRG
jgi:hypothetical protein